MVNILSYSFLMRDWSLTLPSGATLSFIWMELLTIASCCHICSRLMRGSLLQARLLPRISKWKSPDGWTNLPFFPRLSELQWVITDANKAQTQFSGLAELRKLHFPSAAPWRSFKQTLRRSVCCAAMIAYTGITPPWPFPVQFKDLFFSFLLLL